MKSKPAREGYKFWALCCSKTGYVWHFEPWPRVAAKTKIADKVKELMETLPYRDRLMYVVVMDNLFTTKSVMKEARKLGIGTYGTTRPQTISPEMKRVTDPRYNTTYYQKEDGYATVRWVDNNVVRFVTNVHDVESMHRVVTDRKKPRKTDTNKDHIEVVWGSKPRVAIPIPKLVNDYNHFMLAVDLADQYIGYYDARVRCRRIWMPMFLHAMQVAR